MIDYRRYWGGVIIGLLEYFLWSHGAVFPQVTYYETLTFKNSPKHPKCGGLSLVEHNRNHPRYPTTIL